VLVFVVPSTGGLNAGYSRVERLDWFRRLCELRDAGFLQQGHTTKQG